MMFRSFLAWWIEQLAGLLPARLLSSAALPADALVVVPIDGTRPAVGTPPIVELSRRRNGKSASLGRFALDEAGLAGARRAAGPGAFGAVVLQLGPGHLLEKHLTLPLAAERGLDQVLGFEMERETPFSAEEVFWAAAVVARDSTHGRLLVRLSLVPRAALSAVTEALSTLGLSPSLLAAASAGSAGLRVIPLGGAAHRHGGWQVRALPLLAGACAALALLALALPFLRQELALRSVETRIVELQPAVDEVQALRRRLVGGGDDGIAAERAQMVDPLQVLAAATDALPDDAYLVDLALKDAKLSLNGQAASAAPLLAALAAHPAFKDPRFGAPVTTVLGDTAQVFSILADVQRPGQ
jgi:general secretion pathway protein L